MQIGEKVAEECFALIERINDAPAGYVPGLIDPLVLRLVAVLAKERLVAQIADVLAERERSYAAQSQSLLGG